MSDNCLIVYSPVIANAIIFIWLDIHELMYEYALFSHRIIDLLKFRPIVGIFRINSCYGSCYILYFFYYG